MAVNNFDYQLSWSDFSPQSITPGNANEFAQIHPDMTFSNFTMSRNRRGVVISGVDINIRLITDDCWVVSGHTAADLLKHEQGHYDIVALTARQFYNSLIGLSAANATALQQRMNTLLQTYHSNARTVDSRYDSLTNHGANVSVQQSWDRQIAAAKANPRGTINDLPS